MRYPWRDLMPSDLAPDLALIPAECINDNGVFLDDQPFVELREQLSMPVYPSSDFIDVLVHEGEPRVAEVAA